MEIVGVEREDVGVGGDVQAPRVGAVVVAAPQQRAQLVGAGHALGPGVEPVYHLRLWARKGRESAREEALASSGSK